MGIADYFIKRRKNKIDRLFDRANQNLENNLNLFENGTINEEDCFSTVSYFAAQIISYGTELETKPSARSISRPAMIISCYMILRLYKLIDPTQNDFPYVINDRVFERLRIHNMGLPIDSLDKLHRESRYRIEGMIKDMNDRESLITITCKLIHEDYQRIWVDDISNRYADVEELFLFSMDKYETALQNRINFMNQF